MIWTRPLVATLPKPPGQCRVLTSLTPVTVIEELLVLRFAARSKPINSVSDYKDEKDNRDQVATPLLAKGRFEVISHHGHR
jgi:hypothetical protein